MVYLFFSFSFVKRLLGSYSNSTLQLWSSIQIIPYICLNWNSLLIFTVDMFYFWKNSKGSSIKTDACQLFFCSLQNLCTNLKLLIKRFFFNMISFSFISISVIMTLAQRETTKASLFGSIEPLCWMSKANKRSSVTKCPRKWGQLPDVKWEDHLRKTSRYTGSFTLPGNLKRLHPG